MKLNIKKPKFKNVLKKKNRKFYLYLSQDSVTLYLLLSSLILFAINLGFLILNYSKFPTQIPLWMSLPWSVFRLSSPYYIFIIPLAMLFFIIVGVFFTNLYLKNNIKEVSRFIAASVFISCITLSYSVFSIYSKTVLKVLNFSPWFLDFVLPMVLAFFITFFSVKLVIKYAEKLKIVHYPNLRLEPANLHTKPTPRGGAIAFFLGFAIPTMLFLWYSQRAWGLVIGVFITTLTGYLDDRFKLNFLPRLLFLLPFAFIVVILSGFVMFYIPNPLGEPVMLDSVRYTFELFGDTRSVVLYGALVSFVWFMWMANMVSWNNGVDGQFLAITIPLTLTIALLSLRFGNLTYEQKLSAQLAFITLGALAGMFKDTFPPMKIMWGFGATGVGLILAALSITSGTRVATALLVLLVPSIDVAFVIFSRLKDKKNPFMGDRNHLHHKLIDMGWSKKSIALFYWLVGIIFASISISLTGVNKALTLLTLTGLMFYAVIVIRRSAEKFKKA